MPTELDRFIPEPDVRERFERTVRAPTSVVMRTAYEFDMQSIWLIRTIINTRKFLLGGTQDKRSSKGLVEETRELGWGTLVEEPGRLLICGAVCQPWFGDVKFTAIPPDEFAAYNEPEQVKIAWTLETIETEPNVTLFAHEVRAVATDDEARRKFKRYWRWARFGIVAIRLLLLPAIQKKAESMDGDREDWDRAWTLAPHRRLLDISKFDFAGPFRMDLGDVVSVSVTIAPFEYADKLCIEDDICPICGATTVASDRTRVSVNPVFTKIPNLAFGSWAHSSCLENCPIINDPTPIPW